MLRRRCVRAGVMRTASLLVIAIAGGAAAQDAPSRDTPETKPDVSAPPGGPTPPPPHGTTTGSQPLPQVEVEARRPRRQPAQKAAPRRIVRPASAPAVASPAPSAQPAPSEGIYATPAPVKERYQLPSTTESVTAKRIEQTVNAV